MQESRSGEVFYSFKPNSQTTEILEPWDTGILEFPNRILFVMLEYRYVEISNSSHTQNEKSGLFQ